MSTGGGLEGGSSYTTSTQKEVIIQMGIFVKDALPVIIAPILEGEVLLGPTVKTSWKLMGYGSNKLLIQYFVNYYKF